MPLTPDQKDRLFTSWSRGDPDAHAFLRDVGYIARLADDVVDGDADDPVQAMADLLHIAMGRLATNPFYQTHAASLVPVVVNAILLWQASERWRKSPNRKTRMFAFVHREGVQQIAYTVAYITGGLHHAAQVVEDLHREAIETSAETFEDWETE